MQKELIKNIKNIKEKIDLACSKKKIKSKNLTLIAVSKKKSHELIKIVLENGIYNFGENYAQELMKKSMLINSKKIIWHYIFYISLDSFSLFFR